MSRSLYVLRPYSARIRDRVLPAMTKAGLSFDPRDVVAAGAPDAEVMSWLRHRPVPAALLVPFNAHRGDDGRLLHGLELISRISRRPRLEHVPVFSPISNLGLAAASLLLSRYEERDARERVLFLHEDELGDADLDDLVRMHLRAHRLVLT